MKFEDHCNESIIKLGEPFKEVHIWLDEFMGAPGYGARHRRKRHHLAGIAEARILFGDRAAEAARLHIISDLKMEGWKETDHFPRDENDYMKMGLF